MSREPEVLAQAPLRDFILQVRDLMASPLAEPDRVQRVKGMLEALLRRPAWLPEACRAGHDESYARHLLYREPEDGFCIVTMVWGPGQETMVHDHAGVWCVEGVYEGMVEVTRFDPTAEDGNRVTFHRGEVIRAGIGACGALIPPVEYHQIANRTDRRAISLHVYAQDLKICHVFHPLGGDLYEKREKAMRYNSVIPLALSPS
jgi:predicted metal-dependent enzyme (double-stranded beta helix superfamily)